MKVSPNMVKGVYLSLLGGRFPTHLDDFRKKNVFAEPEGCSAEPEGCFAEPEGCFAEPEECFAEPEGCYKHLASMF